MAFCNVFDLADATFRQKYNIEQTTSLQKDSNVQVLIPK